MWLPRQYFKMYMSPFAFISSWFHLRNNCTWASQRPCITVPLSPHSSLMFLFIVSIHIYHINKMSKNGPIILQVIVHSNRKGKWYGRSMGCSMQIPGPRCLLSFTLLTLWSQQVWLICHVASEPKVQEWRQLVTLSEVRKQREACRCLAGA